MDFIYPLGLVLAILLSLFFALLLVFRCFEEKIFYSPKRPKQPKFNAAAVAPDGLVTPEDG